MFRYLILALLLHLPYAALAVEPDARWPDFGVQAESNRSGDSSYFQGFESACFGAPYSPAPDDDWIRFYSEVTQVASGSSGIASRSGVFHAELTPPLPGAPGANRGAFTRLGGYANTFAGGFIVEVDVYLDLSDPEVLSGVNADYGFDVASAVNTQAGAHRRDFIFHAASNTAGQILIGSSNTTNFAPRGDLAGGPHFVVNSSGWYGLQWVYRDMGDGTLAVDTNLLDAGGSVIWTNTLNNPADVIATQIGGNRYLWFLFHETDRLPIDNSRINTGILEATLNAVPAPGTPINLGTALVGNPTVGSNLHVESQGTLRLEICACNLTGPAAADFSITGCPTLIEPGNSQDFALGCTPSAEGTRNATLELLTNDSAGGGTFSYALTCSTPSAVPSPPANIPVRSPLALALLTVLLGTLGALTMRRRF